MHDKRLKIAAWIAAVLIVLLVLVRVSAPWAVKKGVQDFFMEQGVTAVLGDVDLELLDGSVLVKALSAQRDGATVLELRSLRVAWSWSGLFDLEGRVLDFDLDGLDLLARQEDEQRLVIAGIDLSKLGSDAAAEDSPGEGEPSEWKAGLGHLKLGDSRLCYSSHVSAGMDYCIRFDRIEWSGDMAIDLSQLAPGVTPLEVAGDLEIDALEIHNNHHDVPVFELPKFAMSGVRVYTLGNIGLQQLVLSGDINMCYGDYISGEMQYCLDFQSIEWDGDVELSLAESGADIPPLRLNGNIAIDTIRVRDQKLGRALLDLSSVKVGGLAIDTVNDIVIEHFEVREPGLMQRAEDGGQEHITAFAGLSLNKLRLQSMNALHISEITIEGQQMQLVKNREGEFEFSAWLPTGAPESEQAEAAPQQASSAEPGEAFTYRIDRFSYTTDKSIVFTDLSLPEPFTVTVNNIDLEIDEIDSRQPKRSIPLKLSAVINEHGKFELGGTVAVLADKRSFDLDGSINGLDLRNVSAYTKGTIGYSIKSGQLDSELVLKADDDILDSLVKIELHQFALKALSKEDEKQMEKSMGFPLSTSLALLRDRDGAIRLEIPITGDLNKPDFDPGDVINKATSKAITAAVLNYYTPYGLVLAADGLFSLATALRFDPIEFEPGSDELNDTARSQLEKSITLLKDRPGVRLTLCGFTTLADSKKLVPDRATGKDGEPVPLTEAQRKVLTDLGESRANSLKRHLVSEGITGDRLILCAPGHEDEASPGRVELSI